MKLTKRHRGWQHSNASISSFEGRFAAYPGVRQTFGASPAFGDTRTVILVDWDPRKAAANLKKHGVDFHEAATALEDALSVTYPDPDHSLDEQRYLTIGASAKGVS